MDHVLKLLDCINPDASAHGALVFGLVCTGVDVLIILFLDMLRRGAMHG